MWTRIFIRYTSCGPTVTRRQKQRKWRLRHRLWFQKTAVLQSLSFTRLAKLKIKITFTQELDLTDMHHDEALRLLATTVHNNQYRMRSVSKQGCFARPATYDQFTIGSETALDPYHQKVNCIRSLPPDRRLLPILTIRSQSDLTLL
jgi:hypothetical protein